MEAKALRGVPWTILGFALKKTTSIATTLVLAHLLVPDDFGVVALATLLTESLSYVVGLGVTPAFVVRHDLGSKGPGTALSLMVLLGVLTGGLLAAAAPFLGSAMHEPRVTSVLLALAALAPLSGFSSFYATTLQRELEFRRGFVAQTARVVAYTIVALLLAANGAGVWSLVGGMVAASLTYLAVLLLLSPNIVAPAFDRSAARKLCSTGADFVVQGGVSFVQQNVDYLVIGRVLGANQLGLYSMAFRLGELPYYAIADPVAEVTFPGFARMKAHGGDVGRALLPILQTVALASVPFGVLLSATAEPFTQAVLGDRWRGMVSALTVLGLWGAMRPMQTMPEWLLNAVGYTRLLGLLTLAVNALQVPLVLLAVHFGGIAAVAWTMVAGLLVFSAILVVVVRRHLGVGVRSQWRAVRAAVLAAVPTWVVARAVVELLDDQPVGLVFVCAAAAGFATYAAVVTAIEPGLLRRVVRDVWNIMIQPSTSLSDDSPLPTPAPPESHGAAR